MATQKPISTISYNTLPFLLEKLNVWYDAHIIQAFQLIKHIGENGDKDHIHLRIEPNRKIDAMELTESLKEYVQDNPKPLGVRPWRPSKEEDWCLYVLHDVDYLKIIGQDEDGKIPYDYDKIIANENYDVKTMYIRAKQKIKHTGSNIVMRLQQGESAIDMIKSGENVFTTKAILQTLNATQYTELANDYHTLQAEYNMLLEAIKDKGLIIIQDNNKLVLHEKVFDLDLNNNGGESEQCI